MSSPVTGKDNQNGFYITIFEKAYTLMNRGSIWNLQGGEIEEAMFDLTGAPARRFEIWKTNSAGEAREAISPDQMKEMISDKQKEKREAEEAKKKAEEEVGIIDKIVNFFKGIGGGDDAESKQSSVHQTRPDFVKNGIRLL